MSNTKRRRLMLRCLNLEQFSAHFGRHLGAAKQAYLSVSDTSSNCWQLPLFPRMQPCLIHTLSLHTTDSVLFAEITEELNHKSKVIRSEIIMLARNQPEQGPLGMCEFKLREGISLKIQVFIDEDNDTLSSEENTSERDLEYKDTEQGALHQVEQDQGAESANEFLEDGWEAKPELTSEINESEYADKIIINLPSSRMRSKKWFDDNAEDRPLAIKQLFLQPIIHLENCSEKKKYIDGRCPTLTDFQIEMKPQIDANPQKSSSEAKEEMTQILLSRIERTKMYKHPFHGKKTPTAQPEEFKLNKIEIPSFEKQKLSQQPTEVPQKINSKKIDCGMNTDQRGAEIKQLKVQKVVEASYRSSKIEGRKSRKNGGICKRLQSERLWDQSQRQSEFEVSRSPQMTEGVRSVSQSIDLQIYSVSAHLHSESFEDTFVQICIGSQKIRTSGQPGVHLLWANQQFMFKRVSPHQQIIITLHHPALKEPIGAASLPVLSLLNQDYIQLCAINRRVISAVLVLDYLCKPNLPVIRGEIRTNRNSMGALRRPKQMTKLSQMAPTESSMQLKRYVGGSNVRIGRAARFGKGQYPPYLNIKMSSSRQTPLQG